MEELLPRIPACCCIILSGLLRAFLQVFGDKEFSKKYLCLLVTTTLSFYLSIFFSDDKVEKDERLKYRSNMFIISGLEHVTIHSTLSLLFVGQNSIEA